MSKSKHIKVLITTPNIYKHKGGVANHFLGLSKYLPKDRTKFCYTGGLREYNKLIAAPLYVYQYLKFIWQLLIFKPDVVNLNPSLCYDAVIRDGIFLLISKAFNKKVIIFWHGWKVEFEDVIEKKYLKFFKSVFEKADAFVILSSTVKEKLKQWGFSQPVYATTTKVDNYLINELDINNKKQTHRMLFLGRLEENKGIFETLRAFQIAQKKYPNITLTYAGNGQDEKILKKTVEAENIINVHFSGFIRNTEKISKLLDADIFILPSYTEGMPTVVLEAMAFGVPVITRPVGGIPDFFIENKMGYLIQSKDPKDFADKIELLYSNKIKWSEVSKYNHQYALANFMASDIAAKMVSLYEKTFYKNNKKHVR